MRRGEAAYAMSVRWMRRALVGLLATACGCARQAPPPWKDALDRGEVIRLAPTTDKPPVVAVAATAPEELLATPARAPAQRPPRNRP